jgi:dihydrofolate reductase
MRKVIVSNNVTLDGRVDEVRDWALPGDNADFVKHHTELLSHSDGLLLGRRTYEFFAAVWPSRSGEFPDRMNSIAKYVASTTLEAPEWENTHLIEGDVPEAVARLKEQPGQDLVVYGSHDLTHSLLEHDLIDEYQLWVYPVVLGSGRSFFEDGVGRIALDLVDTTVIPPGVAILTYRRNRSVPAAPGV